jgi:hypothetical protein
MQGREGRINTLEQSIADWTRRSGDQQCSLWKCCRRPFGLWMQASHTITLMSSHLVTITGCGYASLMTSVTFNLVVRELSSPMPIKRRRGNL